MVDMVMLDKAIAQIKSHAIVELNTVFLHGSLEPSATVETKSRWYQGSWREIEVDVEDQRCKTSMCLAGWVAELDPGVSWKVDALDHYRATRALHDMRAACESAVALEQAVDPKSPRLEEISIIREQIEDCCQRAALLVHEMTMNMEIVVAADGSEQPVAMWAKDRLNLTGTQANSLFMGENLLGDIETLRDRLWENEYDELDLDE